MEKHIEVIGIDHGWSNMKTATQIFTTGVKEITTEPAFYDDVVELDGKYYKVGGKRLEVRDTKVENDNFYLLTLAAVAKELNRRGMKNADVLLSVGLPLTRFGAEKQDFIDYLSKKKEAAFRFEKEKYTARIARVSVFPQCYAAVAEQLKTLPGRVVVVDIGSWTIDIMPIENGKPNEAECITSQQGLIRCMRIINEECNRQIGQELEENVIQQVMATGEAALPDKYMNIVKDCLRDFAQKVYNTLKEHGYNLDVMEEFAKRAERIHGGGVDPKEDNFLKITGEARLLGTDARLLELDAPNNPDGKLNKVAANAAAEYFAGNRDGKMLSGKLSSPSTAHYYLH